MKDIRQYVEKLLSVKAIPLRGEDAARLDAFAAEESISTAVTQIQQLQQMITDKWQLRKRVDDILRQSVSIPNATAGKPYEGKLDFIKWGWNDIVQYELTGLEETGLNYDHSTECITGTPVISGDISLNLTFKLDGETAEEPSHQRPLLLIINPNAKLLWKNELSDTTDAYWKEDTATAFGSLGDRKIVAASVRGRSHANTGGFRDDDFAFQYYDTTGWNIVAVADGAGSANLARLGSRLACTAAVQYFSENLTEAADAEFGSLLEAFCSGSDDSASKNLSQLVYQLLSKAAHFVHQQLAAQAKEIGADGKDLHTTLAFTLFKKYTDGYALLSFGVGDSPMAVLNRELSEVTLLNTMDVGSYGGGTRFITMPEIFQQDSLVTRIRFKWMPDFSYLMLMTDGIYDPKFGVEAALDNPEKWKEFVADLQGNNEDSTAVVLEENNEQLPGQLAAWMGFWSPGNNDDRTLAIVF